MLKIKLILIYSILKIKYQKKLSLLRRALFFSNFGCFQNSNSFGQQKYHKTNFKIKLMIEIRLQFRSTIKYFPYEMLKSKISRPRK